MDRKDLRKKLIAMRDSITDYLDNLALDDAEEMVDKKEKPASDKADGKED